MLNNYLTKNSEDVVMANQLYSVSKGEDVLRANSDKEQVIKTI